MDEGTNQAEQQHAYYQYPSATGHRRQVTQQQQQLSPARSPEGFRRPAAHSVRHGRAQAPSGGISRRRIHRSTGTTGSQFGTHEQRRGILSLSTESLQNVALQFQQTPLSPESTRHVQTGRQFEAPQHIDYSQQQAQQLQQEQQVSQGQYDAGIIYDFDQTGTAQIPYTMSLPEVLTARHAASLSALPSARFGVPQQYFTPADDQALASTDNVSQYLSAQRQLATYQRQSPLYQRMALPSNTTTMASFNPTGTTGNVEQQHQRTQNASNLEEAYNQYQQALVTILGHTQRGNLSEASRLLLELSAWLVDNARDLGLFRDDPSQHVRHTQLWNDFNICWLALFQKQKDLTEALLGTGRSISTTMLNAEVMEQMGQELIRFCDTVEPHGLVDYQLGIWEEEILDIIGQCLDLLEP